MVVIVIEIPEQNCNHIGMFKNDSNVKLSKFRQYASFVAGVLNCWFQYRKWPLPKT